MNKISSKIFETFFTYNYSEKNIEYSIWTNNTKIENVVFLGTVQIGKMPRWVCEHCPPNTAVVQGAPHWIAKSDGSDIPEFMYEFTKTAFESILGNYSVQKVNVIADSQAVPGVIELFNLSKYQKRLNKLVLLQPLGLNTFAYFGSDKARINIFKKRILANARYQIKPLMIDRKLRYNHYLLSKKVSFKDIAASAQYNSGLKHDATPSLKRLLTLNNDVQIVCAANDKIFPPNEIMINLRKNNINLTIKTVKTVPHSPLGTNYGYRLLDAAFAFFEPKQSDKP